MPRAARAGKNSLAELGLTRMLAAHPANLLLPSNLAACYLKIWIRHNFPLLKNSFPPLSGPAPYVAIHTSDVEQLGQLGDLRSIR